MRFLFIAAGDISWGSSRLRCYWPARYLDAQVMTMQEWQASLPDVPDAEVYVFQKLANTDQMRVLRDAGRKCVWDVCDPSWWFQPNEARKIAETADLVVASNAGLADDFIAWAGKPCEAIPDRLELQHYNKQRQHEDANPVRLIWFGVSVNRVCLGAAYANLARLVANGHNISLTIMDNQPEISSGLVDLPVTYSLWSLEAEVPTLSQHDIALLPPYPGPWYGVKSNNKTLSAWACGLPVTQGTNYAELEHLVRSVEERRQLGASGRHAVKLLYDVRRSAQQWEALHV